MVSHNYVEYSQGKLPLQGIQGTSLIRLVVSALIKISQVSGSYYPSLIENKPINEIILNLMNILNISDNLILEDPLR